MYFSQFYVIHPPSLQANFFYFIFLAFSNEVVLCLHPFLFALGVGWREGCDRFKIPLQCEDEAIVCENANRNSRQAVYKGDQN